MISSVFAQILRSGREHFNGRFAAARRVQSNLDAQSFSAFLEQAVDPIVVAVQRAQPGRESDVAMIAYDVALELAAQQLVGGGDRARFIEDGWRRLLPGVAGLLAAAPERMLGAVTNALHTLATAPGARPGAWLVAMEKLGPACREVELWLKLGQVAAWRAGLAHFRSTALAIADTLPENLAQEVVGVPPGILWSTVRGRLEANPWFDPARLSDDGARARVAMRVGAFRGLGGLFREPPSVVATNDGHLIAFSGGEGWLLTADAFGATFHRVKPDEHRGLVAKRELPGRLELRGVRVVFDRHEIELPDLGEPTSIAVTSTTLALTSSLTHAIVLVALPQR
jgi:hypothetical protein